MSTQLSRDEIDLYRVEVLADMILDGSNIEGNRILALISMYNYLYQMCIYQINLVTVCCLLWFGSVC